MVEKTKFSHEAIQLIVDDWRKIVASIDDWEKAVEGAIAEDSPSGVVYDLPDFAPGRSESFAVVDLRAIAEKGGVDEPHYHKRTDTGGEVEVHIPIQGQATMVVGAEVYTIGGEGDDHVVVPPETAHFIIPGEGFIDGVVSIPNFDPDNYVAVDPAGEVPQTVQFDRARYLAYLALSA